MDWFLNDSDLRNEKAKSPKEQGYVDVYSESNQTSKRKIFEKISQKAPS